jgi:hypothetical protein
MTEQALKFCIKEYVRTPSVLIIEQEYRNYSLINAKRPTRTMAIMGRGL